MMVDVTRFTSVDSLVSAFVVPGYELFDATIQRVSIFCGVKIDIFLFECTEPTFNVGIVHSSAFTIHTDLDLQAFQRLKPMFTGELTALIGVDDLWESVSCDRLVQYLCLYLFVQGVRQGSPHDVTTVHVDDGRQVHEPFVHRDIRDIDGPDLVDLATTKQIRVYVLRFSQLRQVLARIDRLNAHFAQQSTDSLHIVPMVQISQLVLLPQNSQGRILEEAHVHEPHEF